MKHTKFIAIAAVLTFGIGGAVVASNSTQTANVMNIAGENETPNWVPITPGHNGCDNATDRECTGYKASETSPVLPLAFGNPLP